MGRRLLDRTFLKFILVGLVNTAVGTATMLLCYNLLGLPYWPSTAANYVVGSVVSFFLNRRFTFQSRERGWRPVLRFTVNILACYLVAYGAAKPLARRLLQGFSPSLQDNGAMLAGMGLFLLLNYLGQRFFAFRSPGKGGVQGSDKPSEGCNNDAEESNT